MNNQIFNNNVFSSQLQPQLQPKKTKQLTEFTQTELNLLSAPRGYIQSNFQLFPSSDIANDNLRTPLCLSIDPFAEQKKGSNLGIVPVVDLFKKEGIIRCDGCNAYISSFCGFHDEGRTWKCAMCEKLNTVPFWYSSTLDQEGKREDLGNRSELNSGVYEFIAVNAFMNRDPIAPAYFFVFDVTLESIKTGRLIGIVQQLCAALENEELKGQGIAKIGFITFNSTVHIWSFHPEKEKPHMYVLSDIDEDFLPTSKEYLLVNPNSQKEKILQFLHSLPELFDNKNNNSLLSIKNNTFEDSAFSLALQATYLIMSETGGKVFFTLTSRPSLGKYKISNREQILLEEEQWRIVKSLEPFLGEDSSEFSPKGFYQNMSKLFNSSHISVDLFVFPNDYLNIETLGLLSKNTGGELFYYSDFDHRNGTGRAFEKDFAYVLSRNTTWESVIKCRTSKEFEVKQMYGNFLVSNTKLIQMPNISPDHSILLDVKLKDNFNFKRPFIIQIATVYTDSKQTRRVRILTSAIKTTSNVWDIFNTLNVEILFNYYVRFYTNDILKGKKIIINQVIEECLKPLTQFFMLKEGRSYVNSSFEQGGNQIILPNNLNLFPFFIQALLKNIIIFRNIKNENEKNAKKKKGNEKKNENENENEMINTKKKKIMNEKDFAFDEVSYLLMHFNSRAYNDTTSFLCPHLYQINNFDINILQDQLPNRLSLSIQNIQNTGIYLFVNSLEIYIYIGKKVEENVLFLLFGTENIANIPSESIFLPKLENNYNKSVRKFIKILNNKFLRNLIVRIIKEGDVQQKKIFNWLIEDKLTLQLTYQEFCQTLLQKFQNFKFL
ncbi:sec24-related protein [Anaeramoeba flamelloides]|uniref:Sec24-related protein n=1 Tax=Anaeramoeba flamelloides TaxID=1746091 RepID=A0ABQ8YSE3_9EUKA|nr:sec24-related protein [Anaeramoeba flamelloides]